MATDTPQYRERSDRLVPERSEGCALDGQPLAALGDETVAALPVLWRVGGAN